MQAASLAVFLLFSAVAAFAQGSSASPLAPYIAEDAPVLVLNEVRLLDGTGAPAREHVRIDIEHGRVVNVQSALLRNGFPPGAKVLNLAGKTVLPGLVGMHEHLYYATPVSTRDSYVIFGEQPDSAPRLYLANGVTTARTAGSVETYTDLEIKKAIDSGLAPGPKLRITGPYLEGKGSFTPQMHELTGPDDATRTLEYWAGEGATSWKAYMHITPEELKAAIDRAHEKGQKVTGHLCSVGFTQAAELGIDNLEHGLIVDTEFYSGKRDNTCPPEVSRGAARELATSLDVESAPVQKMIRTLVEHHVAVTSTLAVFEEGVRLRAPFRFELREKQAMSPQAWAMVLEARERYAASDELAGLGEAGLRKEMQFERDFVKQGGLLLSGCDPTYYGGVLAGFGDQRAVELLVEAGFTPAEAIHIATANGAQFLGELNDLGTVEKGKAADLVVVEGNPAEKIEDIERTVMVFKDGVGYDPAKLIESVRGMAGIR